MADSALVETLDQLRGEARQALAELSLIAAPSAGAVLARTSRSRPTSSAPRKTDDVVAFYRERMQASWARADDLADVVEHAQRELALLKARPDGDVKTETLVELHARIVEHGQGLPAVDVAVAVRSSEAIVRRARLLAGRDSETGRRLPAEIVNGKPLAFARGLVDAGYSLRAASVLSGVPRSTLYEHLPSTERAHRATSR